MIGPMIASQFAGMTAVMLWAGIFPFVASWLLDGIIQIFRHNGLKLFWMAAGVTVLVAVAGFGAQQYGLSASDVPVSTIESRTSLAQTVLMFTIPLALIGFGSRTTKLLLKSR